MQKATLLVVALVALLVPVSALADDAPARAGHDVKGPLTVTGHGFFRGNLELRDADESRPVVIAGKRGYVGVLALTDDVKVRCVGHGEATKKETEQGIVYFCKGLRGVVKITGSHFVFRGFANRYLIQLPAGATGTLNGRFQRSGDGSRERGDRAARPERGDRGDRGKREPATPTGAVASEVAAA